MTNISLEKTPHAQGGDLHSGRLVVGSSVYRCVSSESLRVVWESSENTFSYKDGIKSQRKALIQ